MYLGCVYIILNTHPNKNTLSINWIGRFFSPHIAKVPPLETPGRYDWALTVLAVLVVVAAFLLVA